MDEDLRARLISQIAPHSPAGFSRAALTAALRRALHRAEVRSIAGAGERADLPGQRHGRRAEAKGRTALTAETQRRAGPCKPCLARKMPKEHPDPRKPSHVGECRPNP